LENKLPHCGFSSTPPNIDLVEGNKSLILAPKQQSSYEWSLKHKAIAFLMCKLLTRTLILTRGFKTINEN